MRKKIRNTAIAVCMTAGYLLTFEQLWFFTEADILECIAAAWVIFTVIAGTAFVLYSLLDARVDRKRKYYSRKHRSISGSADELRDRKSA